MFRLRFLRERLLQGHMAHRQAELRRNYVPTLRRFSNRRDEMTTYQYQEATPTRASVIHHLRQGCAIRHKSNWSLDRCEDPMVCEPACGPDLCTRRADKVYVTTPVCRLDFMK